MLEKKIKELNELVAINFNNLTEPKVVTKSQEVDIDINKEMYKRLKEYKERRQAQ